MAEANQTKSEGRRTIQRVKRTPLYPVHRRLGARMVEFAGWEMPVQYRGIIEEHSAVRNKAGLFDVSHMGKIEARGPDALRLCQKVTTNDLSRLQDFQAQYNLLVNEEGGVVDDVVVYRLGAEQYLFCVNAVNTDKDARWITDRSEGRVEVEDISSRYVQLALQGPLSEKILGRLTSLRLEEMPPFHFSFGGVSSVRCLVSRTGYTGEDGFEIYGDAAQGERLWNAIQDAGGDLGLQPAGLGARDTLRLEKAFPLYGHELDETTTPLEAGLAWVVKLSKGDFLGRESLLRQQEEGIKRKLVGLEMVDPGIARSHCPILKQGERLGEVTSGTMSPTLKTPIALGYVGAEHAGIGGVVEVEIRGRRARAKIVSLPFYRRRAGEGKKIH